MDLLYPSALLLDHPDRPLVYCWRRNGNVAASFGTPDMLWQGMFEMLWKPPWNGMFGIFYELQVVHISWLRRRLILLQSLAWLLMEFFAMLADIPLQHQLSTDAAKL